MFQIYHKNLKPTFELICNTSISIISILLKFGFGFPIDFYSINREKRDFVQKTTLQYTQGLSWGWNIT